MNQQQFNQIFNKQDVLACVFGAVASVVLIKVFDFLTKKDVLDQKTSRKIVHSAIGPAFMATWFLYSYEESAKFLALTIPAVQGLRMLVVGIGLIKDEGFVKSITRTSEKSELLRGPFYYVIIIVLSTLLWRTSYIGVTIISILSLGDGFADLIGRNFGNSNKLPWNTDKSFAGSISMWVASVLCSFGFIAWFVNLGYLQLQLKAIFPQIAIVSLIATIVESLPINQIIDDNLTVPIATVLALKFVPIF